MQEGNKVSNEQFVNSLTKVLATFNRGGGGAARIELGQMDNVTLDNITIRTIQGSVVASEDKIILPKVLTVFSPDMVMISIEGQNDEQKHKLNAFRNKVRKTGQKLFELENPMGKKEIYFE